MNLLQEGIEKKAVIKTDERKSLNVDGVEKLYDVYLVRLDMLYFNDQNDRIATWLSQYKHDHNVTSLDMTNINVYNDIIHDFITQSNRPRLLQTQSNIEIIGQQEPGVVLADGRIIDGNRRFTCLRNIQSASNKTQHFKAFILEYSYEWNKKEIKKLELRLQHGVDQPVDYDPIERLVGIYNDVIANRLLSEQEYMDSINMSSRSTFNKEIQKAKLMVEFLEFINAPLQFHIVRKLDLNDPLKELAIILKDCRSKEQEGNVKNVVFSNMLMRPEGDATRYMRKIKSIAQNARFLDDYIDEQDEFVFQVDEMVHSHQTIDEQVINNEILTKSELRDALKHSTDKWKTKADGDASRNQPVVQLSKAYDLLDLIDANIFSKMTDKQRLSAKQKLEQVQELLNEIRSNLDV